MMAAIGIIAGVLSAAAAADPEAQKQGYEGTGAGGVCTSNALPGKDQAACRLQMDSALSPESKAEIRKAYEARLTSPNTELEPSLPPHRERVQRDLPP